MNTTNNRQDANQVVKLKHLYSYSRKTGKKQVPSHLRIRNDVVSKSISTLAQALKCYTKKTGAGSKKVKFMEVDGGSPMTKLFDRINHILNLVTLIVDNQRAQIDIDVHILLITPWIIQFDRLLTNIVRIVNDRVSLLWRANNRVAMESACVLHHDISQFCICLKRFVKLFNPRQVASTKYNPLQSFILVDVQSGNLSKQIVNRTRFHQYRSMPNLSKRVEFYVWNMVSQRVKNELSFLNKYAFCRPSKSEGRPIELGLKVNDLILMPFLNLVTQYCKSPSVEKLLAAAVNSCLEQILQFIKDQKFRFNEEGVIAFFIQLNSLVKWVVRAKAENNIAPAVILVQDLLPWQRTNDILHLLLYVSQGNSISSVDNSNTSRQLNTRYLTIADREKWAELAVPEAGCCINFKVVFKKRNRRGAISVLPVLDISNL